MIYNEAVKDVNRSRINTVIKALQKNNIEAKLFESAEDLVKYTKSLIPEGSTTAMGGSRTIKQIEGLSELIGSYDFKDRKAPAETKEEARKVKMEANFVDWYFMGTNAITMDGQLFNVDMVGNRVGALIYGPDHVIIVAGPNKIVTDLDMANTRLKMIAAPYNAKRLNMGNPCEAFGSCVDCRSKKRICIHYHHTGFQVDPDRIKVFFLNDETLGL